jgi:hypothetical protein
MRLFDYFFVKLSIKKKIMNQKTKKCFLCGATTIKLPISQFIEEKQYQGSVDIAYQYYLLLFYLLYGKTIR